jgi:hypothetical protein
VRRVTIQQIRNLKDLFYYLKNINDQTVTNGRLRRFGGFARFIKIGPNKKKVQKSSKELSLFKLQITSITLDINNFFP